MMKDTDFDKLTWIGKQLFFLGAFLTPVFGVMAAMVCLIIIDFITGVYAAWRNGENISSRKLGNTLSKFLLYNLMVLAAFLIETLIVPEVPFIKIVGGYVALTEFKSIGENFNKIYGIDVMKAVRKFFSRKDLEESITPEKEKNE